MNANPTVAASGREDDLYCLNCEYNLRGLPGDPRRCPECGSLNDIGEMRIPKEQLRIELLRLFRLARASTIWALIAGAPLLLVILKLLLGPSGRTSASSMLLPLLFSAHIFILYGYCCMRVRDACLRRPGWLGSLLLFQALGLLQVLLLALLIYLAAMSACRRSPFGPATAGIESWNAIILLLSAAFVVVGYVGLQRVAKNLMYRHFRPLAAARAQQGIRCLP